MPTFPGCLEPGPRGSWHFPSLGVLRTGISRLLRPAPKAEAGGGVDTLSPADARARSRSAFAASRQRHRSRTASSWGLGGCTSVSSPARSNSTSFRVSRRSVLIRDRRWDHPTDVVCTLSNAHRPYDHGAGRSIRSNRFCSAWTLRCGPWAAIPGMARIVVSREPHHVPSRGLRKPAATQPANGRKDLFRADAETGDPEARAVLTGIGRPAARPPGKRSRTARDIS